MRVFHSLSNLADDAKGAVVALGNFDGVHLGHRCVLAETTRLALEQGTPSAVLTFAPHPREFFNPDTGPLAIYTLHEKLALLKESGIDITYLAKFDTAFSQLSAGDFIKSILVDELALKHVLTGDRFAFGCKRQGNVELLRQKAKDFGFGTTQAKGVSDATGPISSSRIREALNQGDVKNASALLGRAYAISGHVRRGDGRGHQLGFPTANIAVSHIFQPKAGVYAARARQVDSAWMKGVANLGTRPTVSGIEPLLEVHCFDFSGNLYEKILEVELVEFIRAEQKFASLNALKGQIAKDCAKALKIL